MSRALWLTFAAGGQDLEDPGYVLLPQEARRAKARAEALVVDTVKHKDKPNHENDGQQCTIVFHEQPPACAIR